jgi:hypothetical protein
MNIVPCWGRAERRVRCACGVEVVAYRLTGGVWVAACPDCGRWFIAGRLSARRRLADVLVRGISSYAHPDDRFMVPGL